MNPRIVWCLTRGNIIMAAIASVIHIVILTHAELSSKEFIIPSVCPDFSFLYAFADSIHAEFHVPDQTLLPKSHSPQLPDIGYSLLLPGSSIYVLGQGSLLISLNFLKHSFY